MEEDNKVERAEEKPKGLIEKIWWAIPPVFLVFVYWPLVLGLPQALETSRYSQHLGSSWSEAMLKSIHKEFSVRWFENISWLFNGTYGLFIPLFMFGFMGVGYIIAIRKKMPLKYRILIPSILGAIGLWVGAFASLIYYPEPF